MKRKMIRGRKNHRFYSKHLSPRSGHGRRTKFGFKPRKFLAVSRGGFRV